MTKETYAKYAASALEYYKKADIVLTQHEKDNIEVADFGLDQPDKIGLQLVVYVNTEKVCAKEMVLLPHQTCPEHRHPSRGNIPGKEETFRCRYGSVYLYVEGEPAARRSADPPAGSEQYFTVFHEICLRPGEQYTIYPNTLHWFTAGDGGAVISEFSTQSDDLSDIFTDPRIVRVPEIE